MTDDQYRLCELAEGTVRSLEHDRWFVAGRTKSLAALALLDRMITSTWTRQTATERPLTAPDRP